MSQKYFYLHVPKTAGTTFNDFLAHSFGHEKCSFHIEIEKDIKSVLDSKMLSGHIPLYKAEREISNFDEYVKLSVFRNPLEQVSSHLRFVRKLSEESERGRFLRHASGIQNIAKRLSEVDFSSLSDLKLFIDWLEQENVRLFHNSQLQYLIHFHYDVNAKQLDKAKQKLSSIDYVGTTEDLDRYMEYITYKLNFKKNVTKRKKLNVTSESYGLDIDNIEVQKVLEPLICYDKIIYTEAQNRFEQDYLLFNQNRQNKFHRFLDKIRRVVNK